MNKKLETGNASPEQLKTTNLAELKILLEREFGKYSLFLTGALKKFAGYKAPKSIFPDIEREKEREKIMLENTKVTPKL